MPQRRTLYLTQSQSFELLGEKGVAIGESNERSDFFFGISIDRNSCSPCIIASPTTNPATFLSRSRKFPFTYGKTHFTTNQANIRAVASYLGLGEISLEPLAKFAQTLLDIFINKEALLLETKVSGRSDGCFRVTEARFGFDDAAYKSSKRQEDIHKLRNMAQEVPEEVEAEKEGIVYVKYECCYPKIL